MLSAPVTLIALGLVFVKVRSSEPTSSLFSRWPDQVQISKCEVRPATPLEISQGAQFGVTMQVILPDTYHLGSQQIQHSIREIAPQSANSNSKTKTQSSLSGVWHEKATAYRKTAHRLQNNYYVWKETEAFNRGAMKSADGIIEVDLKAGGKLNAGGKGNTFPLTHKVFELDTKSIPLPNVDAVRRSNFEVTYAYLYHQETFVTGAYGIKIRLDVKDIIDESEGFTNNLKTVGNWSMERPATQSTEALISNYLVDGQSGAIQTLELSLILPNKKLYPRAGTKLRGLISVNQGWPQEVTLEWPKKIVSDGKGPEVIRKRTRFPKMKFNTQLAPFPK